MATRWMRWLALLPAWLLPALGLLPEAAFSERGPQPQAVAAADSAAEARVIVKYRAGSALARGAAGRPRQAQALGRYAALALSDGHVLGSRTQSVRARGLSSAQLAARLAMHPDVEWAEPALRRRINAQLPNDPFYADGQSAITPSVGQWYLRTPDASIVSAINAVGAWANTTGSAAITVAVLDTGVRTDHPDLAGKLHPGYDFVSRSATANDDNGRDADASDPGDWTSDGECGANEAGAPSSWHGTQVAGLIGAASDNDRGMAGVGRNVMLLPVRVLGRCGGFDDDIIAAMRWAGGISADPFVNTHPAKVINMSLGSIGACGQRYRDVITDLTAARVTVVVAAGNDTGHAVNSPANCPGVIAVAGVRHAGTKVGYSNLGPEVAIAAPAGNCVNDSGACLYPLLTTRNNGADVPGANAYSDGSGSVLTARGRQSRSSLGTSFAAPMVAGTVALMLSANPALTPAAIKTALQATARRFPAIGAQANGAGTCFAPNGLDQVECYCTTSTCGAGLLDAGAAVARVAVTSVVLIPPAAVFVASTLTATVGGTVSLDASPSSRNGVSYRWALLGGGALAGFVGATDSSSATLQTTAPGNVVVGLTVTDANGGSQSSSRALTLTSAPSARIVASNPWPTVGATVTLDGSGSQVRNGRSASNLLYQWSVKVPEFSTDGSAHFTSATNGSTANLVLDEAGDVAVTLTVTDSAGESGSATQSLSVGSAPTAVISVSNSNPAAGSNVTLDAGQSGLGSGHRIVAYQWSIISGATLASLVGSTTASTATLATSSAGTVVLALRVTDDAGATSSVTRSLTVDVASAGGGGALGGGWLLGLAAAVGLLAACRRRAPA